MFSYYHTTKFSYVVITKQNFGHLYLLSGRPHMDLPSTQVVWIPDNQLWSLLFTFWAASRGPTFTRVVGIPDYQKLILEIVVLPAQS